MSSLKRFVAHFILFFNGEVDCQEVGQFFLRLMITLMSHAVDT